MSATGAPTAGLIETADADGNRRYELTGPWNLAGLEREVRRLVPVLDRCAADHDAAWDLRRVDALDHAGAMLLWRAWGKRLAPRLLLNPAQELVFGSLRFPSEPLPGKERADPLFPVRFVGRRIVLLLDHLAGITIVLGRVLEDAAYLIRNPARIPWLEISANVYRTGTQALGITALVGFLIGIVLSYLSSQQLKLFGADAFIISILGISVIRELGPVLAAILVAGRSGSAITAQLGVMRVTQELDAMAVMGIPHTVRLVLPKLLALSISLPLVVLWTDAVALIGGMMAAQVELGIGYYYFVSNLPDSVPIANLWLGLGKGVVFGSLIALIACHFGLRIEPNTESLGIGTTNSVVTSITVVILMDAVFAIAFKDVGIFS